MCPELWFMYRAPATGGEQTPIQVLEPGGCNQDGLWSLTELIEETFIVGPEDIDTEYDNLRVRMSIGPGLGQTDRGEPDEGGS